MEGAGFRSEMLNSLKQKECLKFVITEWNPFTIFLNYTPPYVVVGSVIDVLQIITKKLGICYTLVRAPDTDWGMELPNGSWSGSIGILTRKEAAMSANVYSMSEKRSRVLDFGETIYLEDQSVSYLKPALEPDVAGFLKPYSWPLWVAILLMVIAVNIAILSIQWCNNIITAAMVPTKKHVASSQKVGKKQINWTIFTLVNQALPWIPEGNAVRIVCGVWAVSAFVLSSSYCGNLVAMLITTKLELPFNNFRELAKTDIPVWTPAGSRFNEALLASPPGTKLGDIKKNMVLTTNSTEGREGFYNAKWGIADVRKALIYYLHRDFSRKGYCRFYIMNDGVLQTTKLSFGYPKGSKLRAQVDPMYVSGNSLLRLGDLLWILSSRN